MITFVTDTIKNTAKVDIQPDSDIHHLFYTINGTDPTTKSKKYDGPFTSDLNSVVKTAVFNRKGELLGKVVAQRLEVVKKVK
jgi:hexosaminidase